MEDLECIGRKAGNRPNGVEKIGEIGGYHQALLRLPCYRGQFKADGTIWRETVNWYVENCLVCCQRTWLILIHLGTLFRASQFLSEELPIRLAHRVQELGDLPDGLNEMPSIKKVQDWYTQSFEVLIHTPRAERMQLTRSMLGHYPTPKTEP